MNSGSNFTEDFIDELSQEKEFRDAYAADQTRTRFALLVRALREQPGREWSQAFLANIMKKTQSAVSRIEDPDYGKLTVQTLLDLASAFDLPLWIDFPEWGEWLRRMENLEASCLRRESFDAMSLKSELCKDLASPKILDISKFIASQTQYGEIQNYFVLARRAEAEPRPSQGFGVYARYSNSVATQSSGGPSRAQKVERSLDVFSLNS